MNLETAVTMHLWSFNQVFFAVNVHGRVRGKVQLVPLISSCWNNIIYNCFHDANVYAQSIFPCYRNWSPLPFLQTEVQQQLTERDAETNRLQREVRELRVRKDADCISIQLV